MAENQGQNSEEEQNQDNQPEPEPTEDQSASQPEEAPEETAPVAGGITVGGFTLGVNPMLLAAGGGGLLLLIIVIVVLSVLMGGGGSEPENTAQYVPEDAVVYFWFTLDPGDGQRDQMMDLWSRFNEMSAFEDVIDEMIDETESDSGFNIEDDVLPWVGPELSFAILDFRSSRDPESVAVLGVRDHQAAADFMEDRVDYWEEEEGADFDTDSTDDFEIWVDEDEPLALALSRNWLVIANDEDAMEDVLDLMTGEEDESLAQAETFQAARAAMTGRRFASLYVDLEEAIDGISGIGILPGISAAGALGAPEWAAVSAQWVDRGLVVETVAPNESDSDGEPEQLDHPAKVLPDDTLAFLATAFNPDVESWDSDLEDLISGLETLAFYGLGDPGFMDEFFLDELLYSGGGPGGALDDFKDKSGVDVGEDFLAYLDGQFILGVREFDFQRLDEPDDYAIDAFALLSYQSEFEEDLLETMEDLADWLEDLYIDGDSEDLGADQDAVIFDLEPEVGETAYSPGYVLHDGFLTMGTTEDALEAIIDSQKGDQDNLEGSPEYQRATHLLPDPLQVLFFVDLQTIVAGFDPDDLDMSNDDYEIMEEGLGAVAGGFQLGEEHIRGALAITLFPE